MPCGQPMIARFGTNQDVADGIKHRSHRRNRWRWGSISSNVLFKCVSGFSPAHRTGLAKRRSEPAWTCLSFKYDNFDFTLHEYDSHAPHVYFISTVRPLGKGLGQLWVQTYCGHLYHDGVYAGLPHVSQKHCLRLTPHVCQARQT